jgi:hypothetical protein
MFARFEIKPMLGNYMALDSGTYEEDAEWYDHRKWKEFGGQATKFETGLCNARKSCQEKAVLRHFVSGHMTDEAFCAEHAEKCGYGNSDFVLVEEVAGISSKVEERSEEDKVRVADAWLTVASRPDTITHHRYVPSCIRELVGCPEETGAFWVPRNVMIESPLLDGLEVQTLFRGTLVYGPEKTLRQRARENYPAIKPAVLLRGAEDEHDELA